MRPFAELRPPGVYPAIAEPTVAPLSIADTRTVGFVGLSQKGPLNEPRRITNWDEYLEVFGYSNEHYLSDSVESFFRNGGSACFVVRVAHLPEKDKERTIDHASVAEKIENDDWNKPALRIRALDEGRWGNDIWVRCEHSTGAQALLTRDLEVGSGEAHVSTTRGFEVGALVRIFDRENSDYVVISEVADKVVRWSAETPVNRKHRAASPTQLEVMEFEIHVALRDRREVFKHLQMSPASRHYAPRIIASRSRLIRVDDLGTRSPPPHNMPGGQPMAKLAGGRDGDELVTPEDFIGHDFGPAERSGIMALAAIDEVALLACPDAMLFCDREPGPAGEFRAQRVQDTMISLCENMKDRFAILDCPQSKDIEQIRRWRRRTDSSYCAYYWPWIEIASRSGEARTLPPSGVMAGVFALKDTTDGVHNAPANVQIVGAQDLGLRVTEDHLGILNAEGINSFRVQRGVRPWGARTASSDPDWRYINVRRMFIMLRRSLDTGMSWVTFEPNDQKTWDSVRDKVDYFLRDLFKAGMFSGGNPAESYYVKCDAETNPSEDVDRGLLTCQIGVAPVIPAEFIIISMVQTMGGGEE